ncbi:MAG: fatty acid desaturase family protein [bacterium]|nr:fatty acid desaturase family protein [bacterium]
MSAETHDAPTASLPLTKPRAKWVLDRLAVGLFVGIAGLAFVRAAPHAWRPELVLALPVGLLGGYLLAEFVAGTVHWLADRCLDPSTPVVGPLLIEPFRAHHDDPGSISRHDLFEVAGNNALVSVPLAGALLATPLPHDFGSTLLFVFGMSFAAAAVATNVFHGWAHAKQPPRLARILQRSGLILTPARHARHHRGEHDRAYCVTSGWLNPMLDGLGFFAALERRFGTSVASEAERSGSDERRS